MDDDLRASAWGWTEQFLASLRGETTGPSHSRFGWRSHALRANAILGHIDWRLWQSALDAEPKLMALIASIEGPSRESACESRLHMGSHGLRADAACDWALIEIQQERYERARHLVSSAMHWVPQHLEATRWARYLDTVQSSGPDSVRPVSDSMLPKARYGWVSPERWRRRGLSGRWTRPALPGTALYALQEIGVTPTLVTNPEWWNGVSPRHPAVELETGVAHIHARILDHFPASDLAHRVWRDACDRGPVWVRRVAEALTVLAPWDPSLTRIGLLTSTICRITNPGKWRWVAIRAWLLADSGQSKQSIREARQVLGYATEAEPVAIAIRALRRCGYHREANRASGAFSLDEELRSTCRRPRRYNVP